MPSMNIGDWFGWNCSPAAKAEALAGIIKNAPPVAIMVVTIKHAMAESTGNSINCLSERRMAKLCLTSSQLRENLPIAPSHANKRTRKRRNCNLGIAWRSEFPAPIVRPMHSLGTGNASDKSVIGELCWGGPSIYLLCIIRMERESAGKRRVGGWKIENPKVRGTMLLRGCFYLSGPAVTCIAPPL